MIFIVYMLCVIFVNKILITKVSFVVISIIEELLL